MFWCHDREMRCFLPIAPPEVMEISSGPAIFQGVTLVLSLMFDFVGYHA
jgi:hypothetical protein